MIEKAAPDVLQLIIDVIRPYKAGNFPIWALRKLDNVDKHRLLVPVLRVTAVHGVCAEDEGESVYNRISLAVRGSRVITPFSTPRTLKITDKGRPALDVTFNDGQFFDLEPVVPTLKQLAELVTSRP